MRSEVRIFVRTSLRTCLAHTCLRTFLRHHWQWRCFGANLLLTLANLYVLATFGHQLAIGVTARYKP